MSQMKTLRILVLTVVLATAGAGLLNAECVNFEGIDHCPIGNAALSLSADGSRLIANNLGANGNDGVSSHFQNVTRWEADLRIPNAGEGNSVRFTAISQGQMTSRAQLDLTSSGLEIQSLFTGAVGGGSYRVVTDDGSGAPLASNLTSSSTLVLTRIPNPFPIPWPEPWPPIIIFGIRAVDGGCFWRLDFDAPVTVSVDGVDTVATSITLIENVNPASHYPYAKFTAMGIQSDGAAIVIGDETAISNGF